MKDKNLWRLMYSVHAAHKWSTDQDMISQAEDKLKNALVSNKEKDFLKPDWDVIWFWFWTHKDEFK